MTLETEPRSNSRIVHSELDVKSWAMATLSCAAARPSRCIVCAAASREPGRALMIVGHGLRPRTVEGPLSPGEASSLTEVIARRYRCRACKTILVVLPRGVTRGYRYSLAAIGFALALWSYQRLSAALTRTRVSMAKVFGATSATRWRSLHRWTRCALALFGSRREQLGTIRATASRIATFVAAHAPLSSGSVPLDAFSGAAFCRSQLMTPFSPDQAQLPCPPVPAPGR